MSEKAVCRCVDRFHNGMILISDNKLYGRPILAESKTYIPKTREIVIIDRLVFVKEIITIFCQ